MGVLKNISSSSMTAYYLLWQKVYVKSSVTIGNVGKELDVKDIVVARYCVKGILYQQELANG